MFKSIKTLFSAFVNALNNEEVTVTMNYVTVDDPCIMSVVAGNAIIATI